MGTTEAPPAALARVAAVAAACGLPTPRVQVRTGVRPATVDVRRRVPVLQLGERLLTAADDVFDHVVGHELGHVAAGRRSHPLSYAGRTVLVVFPATSLAGVWWLGVYGVNVAVIVFAGGLCLATAVMTPRLRRSELTCDVYAAHRGYPMTPTAYAWLSEQAPHLPLPLVTPPVVHPPHLAHPLPRGPSHPTGLNPRGHRSPRDSAVQTRLRLLRQLYAGPLRFLDVASVLGTVPQGLPSHRTNVAPALDPCATGERSPVERLGHVSRIVLGSVIACQPNGYGQPVTRCDTLRYVADGLWWREQDAEYIRRRSVRYPGAIGIELEWTVEAAADPRRIVRDPDPKSRSSAIRVIGYSPSPGFVITVIATRSDHAGVTA